ncbi:MAG TPA: PAS domain S-box protein [bacterium]|nr:PAS domain S-box protein [bacterium]
MNDRKPTYEELEKEVIELRRRLNEKEPAPVPPDVRQLYRELSMRMPGLMIEVDPEGKIVFANKAAMDMFGYDVSSLNRHITEFVPSEEVESEKEILARGFADGSNNVVSRVVASDGGIRYVINNSMPIYDDGMLTGLAIFGEDITEHIRAEEALLKSEKIHRLIVETMNEGLGIIDAGGLITYVNKKACDLVGLGLREIISKPFFDFLYDDENKNIFKKQFETRKTGEAGAYELHLKRKDGSKAPVYVSAKPIYDDNGEYAGSFSVLTDISKIREAEKTIKESELKYRNLFTQSIDPIFISTIDGELIEANQAFMDLFQITPEKAETINALDTYPDPETRNRFLNQLKTEGSVANFDAKLNKLDGTIMDCLITAKTVLSDEGEITGQHGIIRDITSRRKAREELKKFKALVDRSNTGSAITNLDGNIIYVNKTMAAMHGYEPEELMGKPHQIFYPDQQLPEISELVEILKKEGSLQAVEILHRKKDGSVFPTIMTASVILDEFGLPRYLAGNTLDITRRKQIEEDLVKHRDQLEEMVNERTFELTSIIDELQKEIEERKRIGIALLDANERLEATLTAIPDTIFDIDNNYVFLDYHCQDPSMLFDSPENFLGKKISEILPENVSALLCSTVDRVIETKQPQRALYSIDMKDGTRHFEAVLVPKGDISTDVKHVLSIVRDITERKRAEDAVRESEIRYRLTIDSMADMIHVVDRNLKMLLVNKTIESYKSSFNLPDVIVGKSVFDVFPFLQQKVRDEYDRVFREGKILITEESNIIDGKNIDTETRKIPIFEGDEVTRVVTIIRDIRERKQSEKALSESEERYRTLAEAAQDFIFIVDPEDTVLYVNSYAASRIGKLTEEVMGGKRSSFFSEPDNDRQKMNIKKIFEAGRPVYIEDKTRIAGADLWLGTRLVPIRNRDGDVTSVLGISRDITERKLSEEELRKERDFTSTLIQASPFYFVAIDPQGKIIMMNQSLLRETEYSEEEVFGKDYLKTFAAEEQHSEIEQVFDTIINENKPTLNESWLLKKNGGRLLVEWHGRPIVNAGGNLEYFFGVGMDITERKRLEQAKTNFLGSISHELRTPLSLILGYSEMLLKEKLPHQVKRRLKIIHERGKQQLRLVEELITLATFETGETIHNKKDVMFWDFIRKYSNEARFMISSLVNKRYQTDNFVFEKEIDDALKGAVVSCDEERIRQVIDNLIENSIKYSPKDNIFVRMEVKVQDGNVLVRIEDRGIGIPDSEKEMIFKPFYQVRKGLHPVSDGMGKGLSIVKEHVESHGGRISFESSTGRGTTFEFTLPIKDIVSYQTKRNIMKILVVDDDRDMVELIESLLISEGFEVHTAYSEKEARDELEKSMPQLVLLDIQLPDGNGLDLCSDIKSDAKYADTIVYLFSAKSIAELQEMSVWSGADGFIPKPFEIDSFVEMIDSLQILK